MPCTYSNRNLGGKEAIGTALETRRFLEPQFKQRWQEVRERVLARGLTQLARTVVTRAFASPRSQR